MQSAFGRLELFQRRDYPSKTLRGVGHTRIVSRPLGDRAANNSGMGEVWGIIPAALCLESPGRTITGG